MQFVRPVNILRKIEPWQDPSHEPFIKIDNLSKNFGSTVAVKNVSLSIYRGEFFCLLGGSGCGKSTLLRILAGLETPSTGKIFIDGVDITSIPPYKRPVNMMFQSYALFPHMTVYDNIAFGLKQENMDKKTIDEKVIEGLELVQMVSFRHRKPDQLSGGQKQRVALARSLVKRPKVLLLDEPLGALDKKLREQTQFELANIQEKVGITFIMVTHDQEEAMTMASRIGVMDAGIIKQVGIPHDVYEYPNSRFMAEFIGSVNIFEGLVLEDAADHVIVESTDAQCDLVVSHAASAPLGSQVSVAIRPEKIMLSKVSPGTNHNCTKGIVKEIAYLGDMSIYYIQLSSGRIVQAALSNMWRLNERDIQWEEEVFLYWRAENGVVLTA